MTRHGWLTRSLAALLAFCFPHWVDAQGESVGIVQEMSLDSGIAEPSVSSPPTVPAETFAEEPLFHVWGSADYLRWWVKGSSVVPLITRYTNPGEIGALNGPSSQVIFGGTDALQYDMLSGGRITIGGGRDGYGIQGTFLFLAEGTTSFAASEPGGTAGPYLAVPFNATQPFGFNPGGETSFNSGNAPITFTTASYIQVYGGELNGVMELLPASSDDIHLNLSVLGGFRYLYLRDNFELKAVAPDSTTGGVFTTVDSYSARNDFFGGQFGMRAVLTASIFSFDISGKLGFGAVNEVVRAAGYTSVTNGAFANPSGTVGSGILTMPSNSGKYGTYAFAFVPEVRGRFSVDLTENFRASVGYNFLYMSEAVRASEQVSRVVNPTQNAVLSGVASPSGTLVPVQILQRSDFWMHGMTVGMEFRY